jgi:hypothetical protein
MHKSAGLGFSLSEETITECALYNIAVAHQQKDIVIDVATKPAEARHGGDREWWLIRGTKGICIRVQAKRLFANGRYNGLKVSGTAAYAHLDKLVASSSVDGAIPLYCFYNFPHAKGHLAGPCSCGSHDYRGPSFWGCTLAFPHLVRQKKSNEFGKLRSVMYPWHLLVCQSNKLDLPGAASEFVRERAGVGSSASKETVLRALPDRVMRLIELADENRKLDHRDYLDASYLEYDSRPRKRPCRNCDVP